MSACSNVGRNRQVRMCASGIVITGPATGIDSADSFAGAGAGIGMSVDAVCPLVWWIHCLLGSARFAVSVDDLCRISSALDLLGVIFTLV